MDKLQATYNYLKERGSEGLGNDVNEFRTKIQGDSATRAAVYNYLKDNGSEGIGNGPDEFLSIVVPPTQVPAQVQAPAQTDAAKATQRKDPRNMTAADFQKEVQQGKERLQANREAAKEVVSNPGAVANVRQTARLKDKFNNLKEVEKKYYDTESNKKEVAKLATGNGEISPTLHKNYVDKMTMSREVWNATMDGKGTDEGYEAYKKNVEANAVRQIRKEDNRAVNAGISLLKETDDIQRNADRQAYGNALDRSFIGGFGRGFGDKFDASTWTFGVRDAQDSKALLQAVDKADKGEELTPTEEDLLEAAATNMAAKAYFGSSISRGYKAGTVTSESLPFMLEMLINPASTAGSTIGSKVARYALKKFGSKAAAKAVGVGARVAGDIAGAGIMTGTTGAAAVVADARRRQIGDIQFDLDENGNAIYKTSTDREKASTAVWKAVENQTIERHSELVGAYFAPILGGVAKGTRVINNKIGLKKVNDFIDNINTSEWSKNVGDFMKATQWHGTAGEFAEEIVGGVENALLVGDQTIDTDKERGVFNPSQMLDTFLGVAAMGVAVSGVKTLGYKSAKTKATEAVQKADERGSMLFNEGWVDMRNNLDQVDSDEAQRAINKTLADPNLTGEQKKAVLSYAKAQTQRATAFKLDDKFTSEQSPQMQSYNTNYEAAMTGEQKADIGTVLEQKALRNKLSAAFGVDASTFDATYFEYYFDYYRQAEKMIAEKPEMADDINKYISNRAIISGTQQKYLNEIETQKAANADKIKKSAYNNQIIDATGTDGERYFIIDADNAEIVNDVDDAGQPVFRLQQKEGADNMIIARDSNGEVKPIAVGNILKVNSIVDAQQALAESNAQITESVTSRMRAEMYNEVPFQLGQTVDIDGEPVTVIAADEANVTIQDNEGQKMVVPAQTLREISNASLLKNTYGEEKATQIIEGLSPREPEQTGQLVEQAQPEQAQPVESGDIIEIIAEDGRRVNITVTQQDAEGNYFVESEDGQPIINGEVMPLLSAAQINEMRYVEPVEQPIQQEPIEQAPEELIEETPVVSAEAESQISPEEQERIKAEDAIPSEDLNATITDIFKQLERAKKEAKKPISLENPKQVKARQKANEDVARLQALYEKYDAIQKRREAMRQPAQTQSLTDAIAQRDAARAAAEEERKQMGFNVAGESAKTKWNSVPKIVGNAAVKTLPNGKTIKGRYVLAPAEAATPSHNALDAFTMSAGFPINEKGATVNDRDYQADKAAQIFTEKQVAANYDGQAVEQVPTISPDGIVYDGNGRVMGGQLAAANGTDQKYIEALRANAANFGFTPEQVEQVPNARVMFVTDEVLPYNTETFAQFNANEKKAQNATEKAVASSKKLNEDQVNEIADIIDSYSSVDSLFDSEKGTGDMIMAMQKAGIVGPNEVSGLMDGDKLSATGREFVTSIMLGSTFSEKQLREMGGNKSLKNAILRAFKPIVTNSRITDYSVKEDVGEAISLIYEAKQSGNDVALHLMQKDMFQDDAKERYSDFAQVLALALEDGVDTFRDVINTYNEKALPLSGGQIDIFSGKVTSKDEIKQQIIDYYNAKRNRGSEIVQGNVAESASNSRATNESRGAKPDTISRESAEQNQGDQSDSSGTVVPGSAQQEEVKSGAVNIAGEENSNNFASNNHKDGDNQEVGQGTPVLQRVSQTELGGLQEISGGAKSEINRLAGRSSQTQRDERSPEQIDNDIRKYAEANGLWIPYSDIMSNTPFTSGEESDNYLDPKNNRVIKVNNLMHSHGRISELLDRIELSNQLFPESHISLIGFTSSADNGTVYPVFSQQFIDNSNYATESEIESHMNNLGFAKTSKASVYSNGEYIIKDVRPRNVLNQDGKIYVIDAEVEKDTTNTDIVEAENEVNTEPTDAQKGTESEEKTQFSIGASDGMFYSTVERALSKIVQEKGSKEQFKAMLLKNGAKQAEMDWMGFDELPNKLTKAEIQDWINLNGIKVEEVEKGVKNLEFKTGDVRSVEKDTRPEFTDNWFVNIAGTDIQVRANNDVSAVQLALQKANNLKENSTKFSKYVLPGGKNYKELLLTMPYKNNKKTFEQWKEYRDFLGIPENESTLDKYNEEVGWYDKRGAYAKESIFKSSHFDEPNILAHVRFDEREANGERVLFIEEFQSDWAQKGKKEGFNTRNGEKIKQELINLINELDNLRDADAIKNGNGIRRENNLDEWAKKYQPEKFDNLEEKRKELDKYAGDIPDMPFKKTDQWLNLAARRMMRYAAENGFDRIAWTTGEQQVNRYDLSKQVDEIRYNKRINEDLYDVMAVKDERAIINDGFKESELESTFGKDIAKTIVDNATNEQKTITGDGLKVGGTGMKAFYDGIVPSAMSKLGKPFEAKVEDVSISRIGTVQSIPVTESMKESVLSGVPLFQVADETLSNGTKEQQALTNVIIERLKGQGIDVVRATPEMVEDVLRGRNSVTFNEAEANETQFSIRTNPAPKKTGVGYKVFVLRDGKLYPPMVANPNGEATPVGVWLDADAAPISGESKTGRPKVKAGGKGTQGGSGQLAYRPGWHLGEIPYALQFNRKDENGDATLFPKDFVWAEVEYAMDEDYQAEAEKYGYTENGKYRHSYAGLPKVPVNGSYHYRTNPNPSTDPWIITGAMKVNKILTNEEVDSLVREAGKEPQKRQFLKDLSGQVYGWTDGKTIFLTDKGFNPNTPIHEYTHIWAAAVKKNAPQLWSNVKELMKQTPMWEEVRSDESYSSLKENEDDICSEALSRLSGSRNAKTLSDMQSKMMDEAGKDILDIAGAANLFNRVKKALSDFWGWVGENLFDIKKFKNAEEIADRVLYDLANKTELKAKNKNLSEEESSIDEQKYNELLYVLSKTGLANRIFTNQDFFNRLAEITGDETYRYHAVYHGSPHAFDRFSLAYIGTGEGAQAYGYGLYFTDKKSIAESYAERAESSFLINGKKLTDIDEIEPLLEYQDFTSEMLTEKELIEFVKLKKRNIEGKIKIAELDIDNVNTLAEKKANEAKAIVAARTSLLHMQERALSTLDTLTNGAEEIKLEELLTRDIQLIKNEIAQFSGKSDPEFHKNYIMDQALSQLAHYKKILDAIDYILKNEDNITKEKSRNLYAVKIHGDKDVSECNFLRWDDEVSDDIYNTVGSKLISNGKYLNELFPDSKGFKKTGGTKVKGKRPDGKLFYQRISQILGGDEEASLFLLKNGIDGIQYPTEYASRGKHEGNYNYVVFDENAIEIQEHIQFDRKPNGTVLGFVDKDGNVYLNPDKKNLNTPIHEYGHLWVTHIKQNYHELYERAKKVFSDSQYMRYVKADPNYNYLSEEQQLNEAMARAIGDNGELEVDKSTWQQIKDWIKDVWQRIGAEFGIKNLTSEQISKLTMQDVIDIANSELLSGEKLANLPETESANPKDYDFDVTGITDINAREMKAIKEAAIADGMFMKAPNGEKSNLNERQWVQVRTKAFKKWFGDWENAPKASSKVVDDNGEPMVVYHGTPDKSEFTVFDKKKVGMQNDFGIHSKGFYFSPNKRTGDAYRKTDGNIYLEYLDVKNPLYLNSFGNKNELAEYLGVDESVLNESSQGFSIKEQFAGIVTSNIKEKGHDGVFVEYKDKLGEVIAFEPTQIKSATDNTGTFDETNSDIRFQRFSYGISEDIRDRGVKFQIKKGAQNSNTISDNDLSLYVTEDGKEIRYKQIGAKSSRGKRGRTSSDVSPTGPNDIQRGGNPLLSTPLRRLRKGEFSRVERLFTENGYFNFTSGEKIESVEDVAYIFSDLETKSIENAFVVFVKDGKATVLHISIGIFDSTMTNTPPVKLAYDTLKPDEVYFVHNHPSGKLVASAPDMGSIKALNDALGIKAKGLIINLTSGKFVTFNQDENVEAIGTKNIPENPIPVQVYSFDRQVFDKDFDPSSSDVIRDANDVAAFVSSHRLGKRKKVNVLIVNNANSVVANIFTNKTKIKGSERDLAEEIVNAITLFGGKAAIIYGDFISTFSDKQLLDIAVKRISGSQFQLLDLVYVGGLNSDNSGNMDSATTKVNEESRELFHDQVSENGINVLSEQNAEDMLNDIYKSITSKKRDIIRRMISDGLSKADAIRRWMSDFAENGWNDEANSEIRSYLIDSIARYVDSGYITDKDARFMTWRFGKDDMSSYEDYADMVEMELKTATGKYAKEVKPILDYPKPKLIPDQSKELYDKALGKKGFKFWEAWFVGGASVEEMQKAIEQATGTKISDANNVALVMSHQQSINESKIENFINRLYNPLIETIGEIKKKLDISGEAVEDYMMMKHGLERNVVLAFRDALRANNTVGNRGEVDYNAVDEADAQYKNDVRKTENDKKFAKGEVSFDEWRSADDELREIYAPGYMGFREKDYSGLIGTTKADTLREAEVRAYESVKEFERRSDGLYLNLWARIKAATQHTMKVNYDSGVISRDTYRRLNDMFEYYIPLKGFDELTSDDVYEYMGPDHSLFTATMKGAKGRASKADSPLAMIGSDAVSSIMRGTKNLLKQRLYRIALNNPSQLLTARKMWFEKGANGWHPAAPDFSSLKENASTTEYNAVIEEFENKMKKLSSEGLATQKIQGLNIDLITLPEYAKEHVVRVMVNGQEKMVYLNANPRATQAINGELRKKDVDEAHKFFYEVSRQMAANFTTRSVKFVARNFIKDTLFAHAMISINENKEYRKRFNRNQAVLLNPLSEKNIRISVLLYRLKNNTLDMSDPIQRYFKEFSQFGGETGYSRLLSVEDFREIIRKSYKAIDGEIPATVEGLWEKFNDTVNFANRMAEVVNRFAVYKTSRELGRTIDRSINDAKEVTVNFNEKGIGNGWSNIFKTMYLFVNAALQSLRKLATSYAHHPGRASWVTAKYIGAGFLMPMLNKMVFSMFGDDGDDDWYSMLPKYTRRNNICLSMPGMSVTIPLPIELRAYYALGEIMYSLSAGDYVSKDDWIDLATTILDSTLPKSPLDPNVNLLNKLSPDFLAPLVQAYGTNEDFLGNPIYKKMASKNAPEFTRIYDKTGNMYIKISKTLNTIGGGDDVHRGIGVLQMNPAKVEHVVEGYLGGMLTSMKDPIMSFVDMINGDEKVDIRNIPVLNSITYKTSDRDIDRIEKETGTKIDNTSRDNIKIPKELRDAKNRYSDEYEMLNHDFKGYSNIAGKDEKAKKELEDFIAGDRYSRMTTLQPLLSKIRKYERFISDVEKGEIDVDDDVLMSYRKGRAEAYRELYDTMKKKFGDK